MSRSYDIMNELPAIFATVSGLVAADIEIGWRTPASMDEDSLPRVLIYNPSTDEPAPHVFGVRTVEYGFLVLIVNKIDLEETTLQLCEDMAIALTAASLTNADLAYMNPGSAVPSVQVRRTIVGAFAVAEWGGL